MIPVLPQSSRTLVTILRPEEVYHRLERATTNNDLMQNKVSAQGIVFTGTVHPDRFSLSLKVSRPNSFLPLVTGRLESTQGGCLIFMKARLFPSTRIYLVFWLAFVMIAGAIGSRQYDSALVLAIPVVLDMAILWISWANFRMQLRLTMKALDEVLGGQN